PVTANFTGGGDTLSLGGAAFANGDLKATALSEGRLTNIAFAGTLKSDKDPMSSEKSADDSVGKASAAGGAAGSNGGKSKGKFGIGVSGAASLTDTTGTTEASLINARIIDAASVKVTATDQTNTFSLAGALAIAMGRDQTTTLAGAYAQNDMGMTVRAA